MSEMFVYMEMFEINDLDERDRFVKMIKALDRVFTKHTAARMKQERENAQRRARKPRKGKRKG